MGIQPAGTAKAKAQRQKRPRPRLEGRGGVWGDPAGQVMGEQQSWDFLETVMGSHGGRPGQRQMWASPSQGTCLSLSAAAQIPESVPFPTVAEAREEGLSASGCSPNVPTVPEIPPSVVHQGSGWSGWGAGGPCCHRLPQPGERASLPPAPAAAPHTYCSFANVCDSLLTLAGSLYNN